MRSDRAAAVAVACALALMVGACGSSGRQARETTNITQARLTSAKVLRDAASKSVDAGSAKLSMHMVMNTQMLGKPIDVDMTVDGSEDFANKSSEMTIGMSKLLSQIPGAGAAGLGGGDLTMEERIVGGVFYMKMPAALLGGRSTGDKPWLKLDMSTLGKLGDAAKQLTSGNQQYDGSQYLAYLNGASDGVKTLGTDTIRGVEATHYSANVDPKKIVDNMPAEQRSKLTADALDALQKTYAKLGSTKIPMDVWIDRDGLLRRMKLKMDTSSMLGAAGGSAAGVSAGAMELTMDVFDYGTPVHIEAPPADETGDFGDLLGSMTGKLTSGGNSLNT